VTRFGARGCAQQVVHEAHCIVSETRSAQRDIPSTAQAATFEECPR
jgi:hypothetical protein